MRVLVIEDNSDIATNIGDYLEDRGHVVDFAGDGVTGLFAAGVAFRLWAVFTLGRFYSHSVRLRRDHRIVESGPYRFVRHPAYAGMIGERRPIAVHPPP